MGETVCIRSRPELFLGSRGIKGDLRTRVRVGREGGTNDQSKEGIRGGIEKER